MDTFVEVKNLSKIFEGGVQAVNNVNLSVKRGQLLTLLGPSGCGKTTILRCIAGLEAPDEGEIIVDGEIYNSVAKGIKVLPHTRNMGMVFQSYAVWPHMDVFDNIAYGLRMHSVRKAEIKRRVEEVIELVGLQGLSERRVTKLSGGQQQRVAVARALVYNPKLLLFDEPLSNLDAKLREKMRLELIKVQRETGITSIYVTHDQAEAMVISDEIIVMKDGRIEQIGNPKEIYNEPRNMFVADFIGIANFFEGKVSKKREGEGKYGIVELSEGSKGYKAKCVITDDAEEEERVALFFRPENVEVTKTSDGSRMNIFEGRVSKLIYLGNYIDYRIDVGTKEIRAQVSLREDIRENIRENDVVIVRIHPSQCLCIKN